MAPSNNLLFSYVEQSQSQKEVTVNEALRIIDALLNTSVVDKDLTAPPGSPVEGSLYIVASIATGAWATKENKIAWYTSSAWLFITPKEGMSMWVADENIKYVFDGTNWVTEVSFQSLSMLGVNATADATNKLSVSSVAVLFNNIGANVQVKVNKNATADTNSFLFQTSFSSRAEFGCLGNDNFTLKVSPDNFSTSYEALSINKDDGWATFLGVKVKPAAELTISSGVVTVVQTSHKIDTEGNTASDDLVTISGGSEGEIIILEPENDARTVVLKHGTGNIRNASASDVSLTAYGQSWMGKFDGTNWIQI
jgi:hypothetical protein